MILSVGASERKTALAATREWSRSLAAHPEVARLVSGPAEGIGEEVYRLYFSHRFHFLSADPERELPDQLSNAGLRESARRLRHELALPEGQFIKEVAPADPLLAFAGLLRAFERARLGSLRIVEGRFVDAEGSHAIVLLTTRSSPFDGERQAVFGEFLERSFEELKGRFGPTLVLERSGAHRFAASSETEAKADVARISIASLAALLLMFIVLFRSLRTLLVALLPLGGGVLVASAVGLLVFDRLHVLTLAFGSTLIGVCIDYPLHYLVHQALLPSRAGPRGTLERVWPALLMGALTTVAGFAGLAASDFPGVRELGLFAGTGVLASLWITRWLVPPLAPRGSRPPHLLSVLADYLGQFLESLRHRRRGLGVIPVAFLVVCVAGWPQLIWEDDVYTLNLPLDPAWLEEDARVRARVSRDDAGQAVLVQGLDVESSLQLNDAVYTRLVKAREAGALGGFRSLHTFLRSEALQRRNIAELARAPRLGERTLAALREEGFRTDAFEPFVQALEALPARPLRLADLQDSPLQDLVSPFLMEVDGGSAFVTLLRGVRDPAALESMLADLEGVHYFDQRRFLAEIYGRYRSRTVPLVWIGLGAVVGMLYLRYRRLTRAVVLAAPALLAGASTLALLSLLGVEINLLHLLGCLLVLCFGVDYAIFLGEARGARDTSVTLLGILLACASTCLSFGLLAASSFPALRSLGLTTGLGVLISLMLAPSVLWAAPSGAQGTDPSEVEAEDGSW
jgi:predicted exporter